MVSAAYETSFLYSEHTWGASSRYYSPRLFGKAWEDARAAGKYRYAEESWREHGDYVRRTSQAAHTALRRTVDRLAAAVKVDGRRLVVYNPLPWPRNGTVDLSAAVAKQPWPASWRDVATGEEISFASDPPRLLLRGSQVPALGYRTFVPVSEAKQSTSADVPAAAARVDCLENPFFRVEFDAGRGAIASLIDKRSGRELVDRKSDYSFGQYLYERFDQDFHTRFLHSYLKSLPGWAHEFGRANLPPAQEAPYKAVSPQRFRREPADASNGNLVTFLAEPSPDLPHRVGLRVMLDPVSPWVELEWFLADAKKPDPWPEAGWLCLPFAIEEPQFRLGRTGSVIDPAQGIIRSANFEMFSLDTGLSITGKDGVGVGVCPIDSPLVSLGRPGAFRFSRHGRRGNPWYWSICSITSGEPTSSSGSVVRGRAVCVFGPPQVPTSKRT